MATGPTLGIIGVGNLGGALAEGAVAAKAVDRVVAADISSQRLDELANRIGPAFSVGDIADAARISDVLVVAVKPAVLRGVVAEVATSLGPDCVLVSVAAGVTIDRIESGLPSGRPVVRVMPNLAMLVGESATALCANEFVSRSQMLTVESVFRAVGTVVRVDESQMHAVTGLTGSGPAYVGLLVEGLVAGAVNKGLQPGLAKELACQLLYGTAKLLLEKGWPPAELKDMVTTPSGTTIAGLRELELHAVRGGLLAAVEAAAERSAELSEG